MSQTKKDQAKTIGLNITDRLTLPNILPQQGGLVEQITAKDIRKKVKFSQEDFKKYEMEDVVNPNGSTGVKYNPSKDKPVAIEFTDEEIRLMSKAITLLDKQKKITPSNIDTVLKFKNA